MLNLKLILNALVTLLLSISDLPGSSDPAEIKRYEGSSIWRYEKLSFDRYVLPLGKMTRFDFGTKVGEFAESAELEGQVVRVSYRVPDATRSSLEVFRNYESALKDAGFEVAWSGSGKGQLGNSFSYLYQSLKDNDQLFTYSDSAMHFLAARKPATGQSVALFVTKYENGLRRGVTIEKGEPIVQLDLVTEKVMENKMVLVTAGEMAKAISSSGRVALYGILFDFNSSTVKAESSATIAEIAALLTAQPSLRMLVVGHTDSVGDFEANRALSERRAASVIEQLVQVHGVARDRLQPFGASFAAPVAANDSEEGRAKNRRVELVAR